LNVLLAGNTVLFIGAILSLLISTRFADSDNPNQFVRGVMGGTFIKFGLCLIAGIVYIMLFKKEVQWTDIIALMFLYIIYTVIETSGLTKISRNKPA